MTPDITSLIDQEFEHYIPLLEKFQAMPTSLRLFEEVHAASIALTKKYGGDKYQLLPSHQLLLSGSTRSIAILGGANDKFTDYLSIKDYYRTKFELRREKGYQLRKSLEKMDDAARMTRGPTFMEIIRGWRQFQPYSSTVTDLVSGRVRKINY